MLDKYLNKGIYHKINLYINQPKVEKAIFHDCHYIKGTVQNFEKCSFNTSDLYLQYTEDEVIFTDCEFYNTTFTHSSFSKLKFKNCILNNVKFIECYAEQVNFEYCSFINEGKEKLSILTKENKKEMIINSIIKDIEEC